MKIKSKNSGITLISLVITIIVMLILVGVSITLAVNGGLFEYAGNAVGDTKNAMKNEQDKVNSIIEEYIKPYTGEVIIGNDGEKFSKIYEQTTKITQTEGDKTYTAWIPKGFAVGTYPEKISKISTGLVIRDENGNEFVWIPVTEDLENPYTTLRYSEPTELTAKYSSSGAAYDHQTTLTYLYGDKFNYDNDFKYAKEYEEMKRQVEEYDGFYIGRYETTIDKSDNIGSKYDTKVLTAGDKFTHKGTSYYYRWYGLYYAQKNADVTGNGKTVQTAMIYGQLWDKAMEFIRANDTNYNVDSYTSAWHGSSNGHTGVVNSGQANKTTVGVDGAIGDVALNIWDLEANALEWTQEAGSTGSRVSRGGNCYDSRCASGRSNYRPAASARAFRLGSHFI